MNEHFCTQCGQRCDDERELCTSCVEQAVDTELQQKAVVVRDGARGWRLTACLIGDALDLLENDGVKVDRTQFEVPLEADDYYFETVEDMARELEDALGANGYTVIHDDGYVIYKGLSDEAHKALENY